MLTFVELLLAFPFGEEAVAVADALVAVEKALYVPPEDDVPTGRRIDVIETAKARE